MSDLITPEILRTSEEIMAITLAEEARLHELMPDEDAAILMFFNAYMRLKDFGWSDALYCPKDGAICKVIEAGSTGRHVAFYEGDWLTGSWWVAADGDLYPSRPVLFKLREQKP